MARSIHVTHTSDKSGEVIPRGSGARVRILFNDEAKIDMRADLTDAEAEQLIRDYKLTQVAPRPGRAGERRNRGRP